MVNLTDKTPLSDRAKRFKDFIAPAALKIDSNNLQIGNKFMRTLFVFSYPRFLNLNWFTPIINMDKPFNIALYVHPVDTATILRQLRKKVAQVQSQINEREEKGYVRDPILETAYNDLEALRDSLQQATEKLFKFGVYITVFGDSISELNKMETEIKGVMEAKLVYVKNAILQQDDGFTSSLPLCKDLLQVNTAMNTSPLSATFPFVSADLTSNKGILYGINRHNNSLIIFDRFSLENANSVLFARSGAGKSYAAKLEILRYLMEGTSVIIIDPENEYQYLANTIGGTFLKLSLSSQNHINPFDLPPALKGETPGDTIRTQILTLIGLCRIMFKGITPEEEALLEKAITESYAARDITPQSDLSKTTVPTFTDLQVVLNNMDGGRQLAQKLERFTAGTFGGFLNNPSNISMSGELVVFSLRDLEAELRPIAMFVVLNYIWVSMRAELKKRILLVDEAWVLMQYEEGASFLFGIAKRCRKYYLGLMVITQDVADFMESKYGRPIVTNSAMQLLLKQSPATIDILGKIFNLTEEEKYLLMECNVGEGIFFAGLKRAAIKIIASYTEDQIITSNPAQLLSIEKAKKELAEKETAEEQKRLDRIKRKQALEEATRLYEERKKEKEVAAVGTETKTEEEPRDLFEGTLNQEKQPAAAPVLQQTARPEPLKQLTAEDVQELPTEPAEKPLIPVSTTPLTTPPVDKTPEPPAPAA
jgi:type IV secretory pathway VirB4 component